MFGEGEEADELVLHGLEEVWQLGQRKLDGSLYWWICVKPHLDEQSLVFDMRGGAVAEPEFFAVHEVEPVAPVLQAEAASRGDHDAGRRVLQEDAARSYDEIDAQQILDAPDASLGVRSRALELSWLQLVSTAIAVPTSSGDI